MGIMEKKMETTILGLYTLVVSVAGHLGLSVFEG